MKYIDELNEYNDSDIQLTDSLQKGIDRFMSIKENNNIKFGIILSTYKRADGSTPHMLKEAMESVKNQTYKNFKIYLMGDDYENDEEIKPIIEMFDSRQISYENLTLPGERLRFKSTDLWMSGSNEACNMAINKAISESCNYIVRLDHDDVWTNRHLEIFAKGITKWKDVKFLASTTLVKRQKDGGGSYMRPRPGVIKSIRYNNIGNIIDVSHSSMCWHANEFKDMKYRNVREQKLTEPIQPVPTGADVDMLRRIKSYCVENNQKWIILPVVSVLYRNKKGEVSNLEEFNDERILNE
jgi:glycosyltransferase involved in cell wall biosynthesis